MAVVPEAGAGHLRRDARVQAAGQEHRRVRGVQEPPQLPAAQRVGDPQLREETAAYASTKGSLTRGSLHFPVDEPLPQALVRKLLEVRMAEAFDNG